MFSQGIQIIPFKPLPGALDSCAGRLMMRTIFLLIPTQRGPWIVHYVFGERRMWYTEFDRGKDNGRENK